MSEILNQQVELPTFQNGSFQNGFTNQVNYTNQVSNGPISSTIENKWLTDYSTFIANYYTTPDGKNDRAMLLVTAITRGSFIYPRFEVRKTANNYINPITKKINRESVLIAPFDHISFLAFVDACKREILKGTNETLTVVAKNYDYVNNVKTNTISPKAEVIFGIDDGGYYIIVKSPAETEINHFNKFYIKFSDFIDITKNGKKLAESYVITWLDAIRDWVIKNK